MKVEIITILSLAVAIGTIIVNALTSYFSNKYQYKTALLQIILDSSYKEYEVKLKNEVEMAKMENRRPNPLSFSEYLIFYTKLSEVLHKGKVSDKKMEKALLENKKTIDAYYQYREQYRPEYHKNLNDYGKSGD